MGDRLIVNAVMLSGKRQTSAKYALRFLLYEWGKETCLTLSRTGGVRQKLRVCGRKHVSKQLSFTESITIMTEPEVLSLS